MTSIFMNIVYLSTFVFVQLLLQPVLINICIFVLILLIIILFILISVLILLKLLIPGTYHLLLLIFLVLVGLNSSLN